MISDEKKKVELKSVEKKKDELIAVNPLTVPVQNELKPQYIVVYIS